MSEIKAVDQSYLFGVYGCCLILFNFLMSHLVMCEESIFLTLVVVVNLYLTRVIPSEYLKVYLLSIGAL